MIAGGACWLAALIVDAVSSGAMSSGGDTDAPALDVVVEPISDELADEMIGVSWHPGCPVPISDLRIITMNHWGFDDLVHRGELVVHADVAEDVVTVFGQLFTARFPILRVERIERYDGDDNTSMAADNTSSFNCREIAGGGPYSVHSWGKAIDINPVENPYIKGGRVLPPSGCVLPRSPGRTPWDDRRRRRRRRGLRCRRVHLGRALGPSSRLPPLRVGRSDGATRVAVEGARRDRPAIVALLAANEQIGQAAKS